MMRNGTAAGESTRTMTGLPFPPPWTGQGTARQDGKDQYPRHIAAHEGRQRVFGHRMRHDPDRKQLAQAQSVTLRMLRKPCGNDCWPVVSGPYDPYRGTGLYAGRRTARTRTPRLTPPRRRGEAAA
ncbi:hypothetical protein [Komagataeibacter rhaeticus]|uniref:hypothetical protein n=1 Tax=Komagataeibacter rhaeticus TaxID=215221 RepID=UPI001112566F|nr:hypothetical protein [Komagataeibacter rhaeticus]